MVYINEESAPIEGPGRVEPSASIPPLQPVATAGTGITNESVDELRYQFEKMLEGRLVLDDKAKKEIPTFLRSFSKKITDKKRKELLNRAADSLEKGEINESLRYLKEFSALSTPF